MSLPATIQKYMLETGYGHYKKVRILTDVEATKDPETNPFQSMYKARKLLEEILHVVQQERKTDGDQTLRVLKTALLFQIAHNCIACEERPYGEELLKNCTNILQDDPSIVMHKDAVSISVSVYMELGVINSNRYQNADAALASLTKAETIYNEYKHSMGMVPFLIDELLRPVEHIVDDETRNSKFEKIFTHTLFYLAQVHKQLGHHDLSASYCQKTLAKQLQMGEYNPSEWAINAAGLSQYFVGKDMFVQAKHCLCCANIIIEEIRSTTTNDSNDSSAMNDAKVQHKADIARCWVKYYLALMENSKEKLCNDVHELDVVKQAEVLSQAKLDKVDSITGIDDMFGMSVNAGTKADIVEQDIVSIEQAKVVFLQCKDYLDVAFSFFQLDGYVTDHIELAQDTSSLYKHLLFFEPDPKQRCKMHKRRADALSCVLQEINPQFYLLLCRQLQFELGEIYSAMVDLKIQIARPNGENSVPSQHAVRKINRLCGDSMKYFTDFLNTLKSAKKDFPKRFDSDVERPAILANFYSARLHSKIIASDKEEKLAQLNMSCKRYKYIVDYVLQNPECEPRVSKEYEVCKDMVELLPRTMAEY